MAAEIGTDSSLIGPDPVPGQKDPRQILDPPSRTSLTLVTSSEGGMITMIPPFMTACLLASPITSGDRYNGRYGFVPRVTRDPGLALDTGAPP